MSFWLFLSALMAFPRLTLACDITRSTSFSSTPVSSTSSSSDSSWIGATTYNIKFNPLNAELNPIYLLALLAHHFLHVSRIRVNEELITYPLALLSLGTSLHE